MGKRAPDGQTQYERVITHLTTYPDATAGDTARVLNIPVASVKAHLYQARQAGRLPGRPRRRSVNPQSQTQQVIGWMREHGQNAEQAAAALNLPAKTVKNLASLARRDGHLPPLDRGGKARERQGARAPLYIAPYPAERRTLEAAAARAGLAVEVYMLNAALAVARQQAPQTYTPHQLQHLQRQREAEGGAWEIEELQARGLPLYWAAEWLRAQLAAGQTYSSLAARHGYNVRTLSNHGRRLGISLRRVIRLEEAGPWPAEVGEVAARVFDGDSAAAAQWLSEQVGSGHLRRVQRGVYALPE